MKFINPFIRIKEALVVRWYEINSNRALFLEETWNKGESVNCLCCGIESPIEMGVGKRNGSYYLFQKNNEHKHREYCPLANQGKKGEWFAKNSFDNLQSGLEKCIDKMGYNIWSPNFHGLRTKFLFRKKYLESMSGELVFYPEVGENLDEKNRSEIKTVAELCGGSFYVAGFVYDFHFSDEKIGSYFILNGFDKRFFVDRELRNVFRKRDHDYEFFVLVKFILLKSGKYLGVDAAGIYIHKKTMTPRYDKSRDISDGRMFKFKLMTTNSEKNLAKAE